MTREEQTAKILKNGFRYKGKKVVWFKISSSRVFPDDGWEWKKGNTFWIDSVTGRKATRGMLLVLDMYRETYPQENLEIIFAGIYEKELMEGLR